MNSHLKHLVVCSHVNAFGIMPVFPTHLPNILQETANLSSWQCIHWRSYCWCSASGNILFPQWKHCRNLTSTCLSSKPWFFWIPTNKPIHQRSCFINKTLAADLKELQPTTYFASEKIQPSSDPRKIIDLHTETDMFNIFELGIALDLAEKGFWIITCNAIIYTSCKMMKWATGGLISLQICQLMRLVRIKLAIEDVFWLKYSAIESWSVTDQRPPGDVKWLDHCQVIQTVDRPNMVQNDVQDKTHAWPAEWKTHISLKNSLGYKVITSWKGPVLTFKSDFLFAPRPDS